MPLFTKVLYSKMRERNWWIATIIFTGKYKNKCTHTQGSVVWLWHGGGVIHHRVTDYTAGTRVHTAAAVASLMGFNPTQCCDHDGTVSALRWETSRMSALINAHGGRWTGTGILARAHAHTSWCTDTAIIFDQSNTLNKNNYLLYCCFLLLFVISWPLSELFLMTYCISNRLNCLYINTERWQMVKQRL